MPDNFESLLEQMIRIEDLLERAAVPELLSRLAATVAHERLGLAEQHLNIALQASRSPFAQRVVAGTLAGQSLRVHTLAGNAERSARPAPDGQQFVFAARHRDALEIVVAGDGAATTITPQPGANVMLILPAELDYSIILDGENEGSHATVIAGTLSIE